MITYPRPVGIAGGVVLAGGRSSRMGTAKAALEWHGSTLLFRAAAVVSRAVDGPVVVVAAPGQPLPDLPAGVTVVEDPVEGLGPVQGLAAGLAALDGRVDRAFVCATDLPFLHPAFVRRVLRDLTGDVDVVLPVARGYRQPLAAAYRTRLAGLAAELLSQGKRKPGMLYERCVVRQLDDAALLADPVLARHDPGLDSVVNVNDQDDYAAARAQEPPEILVQSGGATRLVRAATVGAIGSAVILDGHLVTDGRWPLVAGDTVTLT